MIYEKIEQIKSKKKANLLFKSKNPKDVILGIHGAIAGVDDKVWLQNKCLKLMDHEDVWVVRNSIIGLNDLIRIYGGLQINKIKKVIFQLTDPRLMGEIEDLLDDVNIYYNKEK